MNQAHLMRLEKSKRLRNMNGSYPLLFICCLFLNILNVIKVIVVEDLSPLEHLLPYGDMSRTL